MRHFEQLTPGDRERLFHHPPGPFDRDSEPGVLAVALGATLYTPATRASLAQDVARRAGQGVTSMVACLEDAIPDEAVRAAEANVVAQLREHAAAGDGGPLLFLRVRRPEQVLDLVERLGEAVGVLSGFVLPKFNGASGPAFLDALADASLATGHRLLAMPVLESPDVLFHETRRESLLEISRLLAKHRDAVLAVRIGATDLCSLHGLRRPRELTVYDVHVVADLIGDIVNSLARADETGFVVTGPVWEYFTSGERMFRPQLRASPFAEHAALPLRADIVDNDLDALIREVVLDKANGLTGKTVIHPTHVAPVHALSVVTHEEWSDAADILGEDVAGGGVLRSGYANKMNEVKPHRAWAARIRRRAVVFGVAGEGVGFVDLLRASARP